MNLTTTWIESSWMKALGWTFVHSIWQIALIGLCLFVVLKCIPGRSAHTRYTISTLALWTTLVSALCTFIVMLPEQNNITEITSGLVMVTKKSASIATQLSAWLEARMPMMLTIWLGGVSILMLRLMISLGWVAHLRTDSTPDAQLQFTLDQIMMRLKLRVKASASESRHIKSPVTIGHLKPLILFPVGIINQLTPGEVETVLTHELAHIVRRDYLSNIIQSFIETLFYYHPVTWWISRMVRTERENRADDLAVSWCGDHLGYAKALITIQEMQTQGLPKLAVGFASDKGAMLVRIQRILNVPYKNHNQMEKTVLLSLCSLCFLAFTLTGKAHENKKPDNINFPAMITVASEVNVDSIPATGTYKIHKKTDNQDISIEVTDGDIKELKIDGKDIAPAEFSQYDGVIDELFGSMDTPPTVEGFGMPAMPPGEIYTYSMPPMPTMPAMPPMEVYGYAMPELPDMSELNAELEALGRNGYTMKLYNPGIQGSRVKILHDTSGLNGDQTIIIKMIDGDSSMIRVPGCQTWSWSGEAPAAIAIDGRMMNADEMKKWEEQMQQHSAQWEKEWKAQADQWKEQSKQWKEQSKQYNEQYNDQWRDEQKNWQEEQERYKDEIGRMKEFNYDYRLLAPDEDLARELEHQLYRMPSPRLSLSDEMVEDGLIKPGEEVQVQLTPDKLKINGHKMSDELHEKYLRIYEHQQGVELSGNSRVEFTTKSKQHM